MTSAAVVITLFTDPACRTVLADHDNGPSLERPPRPRRSISARNGMVTVLCHHFGWIRVSSKASGCDVEEQIEEMSSVNQTADARVAAGVNCDSRLVLHERETRVREWWGEVRDCYEMTEVGDGA